MLRYEKLVVRDAQGRKQIATMEIDAEHMCLAVNDAAAVYPVTIDPTFTQQAKLVTSDGAANDSFGSSVAISGETLVVGVPQDDIGAASDRGSVYIFVRSGTTWSQQQKLTPGGVASSKQFGSTVAISSTRPGDHVRGHFR